MSASPLGIDHIYRGSCEAYRRKRWKKQRANRGYAFCDLVDMDAHLLMLIPAMLEELAEITDATPYSDVDQRQMTMEEWRTYLLDTAAKFKAVSAFCDTFPDGDLDAWKRQLDQLLADAFAALQLHFFALWN